MGAGRGGAKAKPKKRAFPVEPGFAFIAVLLAFLLLKSISFNYSLSDENLYFYMGKLTASGLMPYRDYLYPHPPLGVLLDAAVFMLFGFNYALLKSIAIISFAASGCLLYLIVSGKSGRLSGLMASSLFLLSYSALTVSSTQSGLELSLLFILGSYYCIQRGRGLWAGLLLGAGSSAGLYAVVPFGCYLAYLALWKPPKIAQMVSVVAGFSVVFLLFNGFFYVVAGQKYIDDVYLYQLNKPSAPKNNMAVPFQVFGNDVLAYLPLVALPLLLFRRERLEFDSLAALVVAGYAAFFISLKVIFEYYFALALPFVCILSAQVILHAVMSLRNRQHRALFVLAMVVMAAWGVYKYVLQEAIIFSNAEGISGYVKANSPSDAMLFGDTKTVPLIAMLAGREVAFNEVDANIVRFMSNPEELRGIISRLESSKRPTILVTHSTLGFGVLPDVKGYIQKDCKPMRMFREPMGDYVIYYCGASHAG